MWYNNRNNKDKDMTICPPISSEVERCKLPMCDEFVTPFELTLKKDSVSSALKNQSRVYSDIQIKVVPLEILVLNKNF